MCHDCGGDAEGYGLWMLSIASVFSEIEMSGG